MCVVCNHASASLSRISVQQENGKPSPTKPQTKNPRTHEADPGRRPERCRVLVVYYTNTTTSMCVFVVQPWGSVQCGGHHLKKLKKKIKYLVRTYSAAQVNWYPQPSWEGKWSCCTRLKKDAHQNTFKTQHLKIQNTNY